MTPEIVLMLLVTAAVLLWPGGRARLRQAQLEVLAGSRGAGSVVGGAGASLPERLRRLLAEDPVAVTRAWWQSRMSGSGRRGQGQDEAVLALLEGIEPGLRAGLAPGRAFELAASALGDEGGSALSGLVVEARHASESGAPVGKVWHRWAQETGSSTLGFVAAAWQLSERTGAPLADAVARAVARIRAELSRRRRAAAAVAGPRATVNVLTVLPLVGPLFGLASGLDPAEVYASSPLVMTALAAGVALLIVGRWWCRRLVESVLPR